jgi:acylphosphatase
VEYSWHQRSETTLRGQWYFMIIQRRVTVSGRVQGVGFRAATFQVAKSHSTLKGYVRNLRDGRVEAVFSGPEEDVLAMTAWCREGPNMAEVLEFDVREENPDPNLQEFQMIA